MSERRANDECERDGGGRPGDVEAPPPYASRAGFLAAVRDGDPPAARAFYHFYAPLLRDQAQRGGVSANERDALVATVLGDVLLRLCTGEADPRDLTRYVVGSFRNRVRSGYRDRLRRAAAEERAYSEPATAGQRIVAECHSAYGLRIARGDGLLTEDGDATEQDDNLASAIQRLAAYSAQALGVEDAALMVGLSRHVPMRELAAQRGMAYGTIRVRIHRLRHKFLKLARQYMTTLSHVEQEELERFFRRAGVVLREEGPERGRIGRDLRAPDSTEGGSDQ